MSEPPGEGARREVRRFTTPDEAEAAFYRAIEHADMAALEDIWSADEAIVCIHPGTARIEGRANVMESFRELFLDAPSLGFSIVDTLETGNESLAVHLVREEIALDGELVSVMLATNVYQVEQGGWRLLLHHASPEPDVGLDVEVLDETDPDGPVLH